MVENLDKYDIVVGYGIGQNYEQIKDQIAERITLDYLADRKWENSEIQEYDNIPIIHLQELKQLKNTLVVLFPKSHTMREVIMRELKGADIDICCIHDLFMAEYTVNSNDLIQLLPEREYHVGFDNRIIFDETVPQNITIHFSGKNNLLYLGKNLAVEHLEIYFGNHGSCKIGDGTSIQQVMCFVSDAEVRIGADCMFSSGIVIRTDDAHHIFDGTTHQRINIPKNVIIGNQVWIGYQAVLLAGACIGTGSVVGARAVTSSCFKEHRLIAGCPAKVIRENVCWSRDNTEAFQRSRLEDCIDQSALKYM